jgi:hypothetical protein
MTEETSLKKTLTLTDLIFFGIASIVGSGGFNLIGEAVMKGGDWWPAALAVAAAVLHGLGPNLRRGLRNAFKNKHGRIRFREENLR